MAIVAGYIVPHPPMIVPAVGRGREATIELTAESYRCVAKEIAAHKPETIIITSPHMVQYLDYFHIAPGFSGKGDFGQFSAPEIGFEQNYDVEFGDALCQYCEEIAFPAGKMGQQDPRLDHGTMVPLYFLNQENLHCKILRIGLSGLSYSDHYRLGMYIREVSERLNRRVVLVASGDLSHKLKAEGPYGFAKEGPEYDAKLIHVLEQGNLQELLAFNEEFCEQAAECGHRSFVILAGAMDGYKVETYVYSHQDVTGVGYGIARILPVHKDASEKGLEEYLAMIREKLAKRKPYTDPYINLAYQTIISYVLDGNRPSVTKDLQGPMVKERAGAFVSIHKKGNLRGCIGTIAPTKACIAEEIMDNAISAATRDTRFLPIRPEELADLTIHVDILETPEPIDSPEQLDPRTYGVIVSTATKRGLLLPDLPGVTDVSAQIRIALDKAGISPGERYKMERFRVTRHGESI